jgi:hypothetical protein
VMDKYMLMIIYTGGVLGSLLNIVTLLQKQFRKNPCSQYFLSASTTDFFVMNVVVMTDVLRYLNPPLFVYINLTVVWCKLQKYFIFLLSCLSSTFITLACIDRFCTSSHSQQLRKLSQLKVSRILIPSVLLIWASFSLHMIILYDVVSYTPAQPAQCQTPPHASMFVLIVDGYFFSMFNGAIVPLFLSIFGSLIYRNVRLSRKRTAPIPNTNSSGTVVTARNPNLNRQNLHLITMLLVQASLTVILNIPYMTVYLQGLYNSIPTNQLQFLVYAIFVYIARWFWFLNYAKTFYLNSLSSQVFRDALKRQSINLSHQLRVTLLTQMTN